MSSTTGIVHGRYKQPAALNSAVTPGMAIGANSIVRLSAKLYWSLGNTRRVSTVREYEHRSPQLSNPSTVSPRVSATPNVASGS